MKIKEYHYYMDSAIRAAQMSHAVRAQVGAAVVTKSRGIYIGYNGTPEGMDNCCEDKIYMDVGCGGWLDIDYIHENWPYKDEVGRYKLVSRPGVIHAEANSLAKMLKEGVSAEGATIFVSLSPCANCSCMIAAAGIKRVVYKEEYRDTTGLEILIEAGVVVEKYNENSD